MSAGLRPRRARAAGLLLLLAVTLAAAGSAGAQSLGTLSLDFVRVDGHGRHLVVASALDPFGEPVAGLEQSFGAQLDGAGVAALAARPARSRWRSGTLQMVVDGTLLAGDALAPLGDAVRAAGDALEPGDGLRVLGAGRTVRARAAGHAGIGALAGGLGALADHDTPLLYDALFDAAREASRRADDEAGAIVLVTRGADGGSDHTLLQVFALARTRDRLTPVVVVLVGDQGTAAESERLQRLATFTAGAFVRVTSPVDLASALPPLVRRARQRWVLTFDAPQWSASQAVHRLSIAAEAGGERREAALEYRSAEVVAAPWWRSPWVWIVPLLLALVAIAFVFALRPRQVGLLVHEGGDEDGIWYELRGLPVTIGAAEGNDLVLYAARVSRNHAVLERRGRNIELADLNSENGTFVNGERISRRALADGDQVGFGPDVHMTFEARG